MIPIVVIGMIYQDQHGGWRWMVGLGAVPAVVQLCALVILPESRTYALHSWILGGW